MKVKFCLKHHLKLAISIRNVLSQKLTDSGLKIKNKEFNTISNILSYRNLFFGYYDISPFNPEDNRYLILHGNNLAPYLNYNNKYTTDILLYDRKINKILKKIDSTYAWNWQQGSRLQWISDRKIIYNCFSQHGNDYYARVYDLVDLEFQDYSYPVQVASTDYYLSLSYKSLYKYRSEYGYNAHAVDQSNPEPYIKKVSLIDNSVQDLVTSDVIASIIHQSAGLQLIDDFWINHITISPDKSKFVFLIRFKNKKNSNRQHILCLFDLKNMCTKILLDKITISHYNWIDDFNLICYLVLNKDDFGYYYVNIDSSNLEKIVSSDDGHPTMIDSKSFITDSYPNRQNIQSLQIIEEGYKNPNFIAHYIVPIPYFGNTRCDLHPSVDNEKKFVQIDVIYRRRRLIDIIELN